uniref:Uncharacterized protein n=1 Tax=Ciona savignyi TaxID=51511 RepID=H2ZPG5_CIOSA
MLSLIFIVLSLIFGVLSLIFNRIVRMRPLRCLAKPFRTNPTDQTTPSTMVCLRLMNLLVNLTEY